MKYVQVPLECYCEAHLVEASLKDMFEQLRKHAIEEKDMPGDRKHLRIIVMVPEEKAKELCP